VLRRDLTAPSALQTATWKYDSEGRVLEEGLGQQKVEYRYDAQDRVVYEKGPRGDVRTITYDAKGFIATESARYPGGSQCTRYEREFFAGYESTVQRLTKTTRYPAFTKIDVVEYDEVGKVVDSSHRTTPTTGSGGAC
jgi:YD repeat-containing protein